MSRARWIHAPLPDLALACCWVPFAVAAHRAAGDGDAIATVLAVTFALSFAHQPLTLPIVYGDPEERGARRRLYTWCPVVFLAAAVGGLWLSVAAVSIVAGLWNVEHTLMQRFGITRIYGRKAGETDAGGARQEKVMLVSWLLLAATAVAAAEATATRVRRLPLGEVNAAGLGILADLRAVAAWLVPAVALAAAVVTVRWGLAEAARWRAGGGNPAKLLYLGSTAALLGVMLVDPVAGFVGYVGAHALEYFVIVHTSLGNRWTAAGTGGPMGTLMRSPTGRRRFLAAYALLALALVVGLRIIDNPRLYLVAVLTFGGLHVLYDGFVWKLRRPQVAAGLVTAGAGVGGDVAAAPG
jgi:hypothetical protein